MFEKEAEECASRLCCTTCKALICKEKCECWTFAKKGFLAGLEQENAEMKEEVVRLKKENAKLQEKLNIRSCQNCKHNNKSCPSDGSCVHYSKWEDYKNQQLTKAKELKCFIKDLIYENRNLCFQFNNTTCLFNSDYKNRAEELIGERL